jgi:predicted transcriptional regulator
VKIQTYKLNEKGLNHFFGPLEARIMEMIWGASKAVTVKEVQHKLTSETPINFNTVMTVMNRLVEKGHLRKQTLGRRNVYRASQTKECFIETQMKAMTQGLVEEYGDMVVNHVLDNLEEVDSKLIQKLEEKLRQLK